MGWMSDDDEMDASGVTEGEKRKFEVDHPVDALTYANPLDHGCIRRLQKYIGKTFTDTDVVGRTKIKEVKKTYKVSNVCLYTHDPTTFFFEYYDCNKFKETPVHARSLEYTQVVEFGRHPLYFINFNGIFVD